MFTCYDGIVERSIDNVSFGGVLMSDLTLPSCRYISYLSVSTQPAFTCSKLKIETREQGVKYVQS